MKKAEVKNNNRKERKRVSGEDIRWRKMRKRRAHNNGRVPSNKTQSDGLHVSRLEPLYAFLPEESALVLTTV